MQNKIDLLKKQLIITLLMLVVSGLSLGVSTYAWFSNNNKVEAQGMSINAVTDESLLIKGMDAGQSFGSVGRTTVNQTSLSPATSSDGINFAKLGNKVNVPLANNSTAKWTNNGAFSDGDLITAINDSELDKYYYTTAQYIIKSVGNDCDIYVSNIDITDSSNIFSAVRCAIKITDATNQTIIKVYNPSNGVNNNNQIGKYSNSKWTLISDSNIYTTYDNNAIWKLNADIEYNIEITAWFEGQDTSCFSENVKVTGTDITSTFTKYEP